MKLILLAIGVLFCTCSIAQQKEIELSPVTITSSLQSQPTSRTGRNIISIPGDNFAKLPVHSIDELLKFIPGIEVQMRGPAGSQSDIVLRGGTFQQVLIILDGLRINDPNTGHFNSYIPIGPSEIERIEILKGPAASIYGSEAVGGVINIISKVYLARGGQIKKRLSLEGLVGEYGLNNINAGGYYQEKNTAASLAFLSNNANGQPQRGINGFFNNSTVSASLKQIISSNCSLSFHSSFDERRFAAQNFYTTFVSDTATERITTNWNQLTLNFQKARHNLNFNAGFKYVKDVFQFNPTSTANNNKSYLLQFQLIDNYKVTEKTLLSYGLQYQDKRIHSNDRGDHSLNQLAGFIVLTQKLGMVTISPSLRLDWNEARNTELVPQLNLSYQKNRWQLRASAGKTIRDADFTERYNNYNKPLVTAGSIGNPNLSAERSFSYEAGADYFLASKIKLSITGFQRLQSQLIDWIATSYADMPRKDNLIPTGTYALARNIAKVTTSGIEADLQYTTAISESHNLQVMLGLTWLDSKTDNSLQSFYISSHARFLANMNAVYSNNRFFISISGIYKHRKEQKVTSINAEVTASTFIMNTKAGVFLWKKKLNIYVESDNMSDTVNSDLLGSRLPRRWFMTGLRLTL